MTARPVTAQQARKIAHDVVGMHVDTHPAPKGHKGMGKLIQKAARGKKLGDELAGK